MIKTGFYLNMGEEKYMKVLSIGKRYGADGIVPRLYNMDIYNLISIYQNDVLHGVRIWLDNFGLSLKFVIVYPA